MSSIEKPKYILQLGTNKHKKKEQWGVKFWLHRYNLKYTLSQEHGLIADNLQGHYAVAKSYWQHELLPWGAQDTVYCLVHQKYQHNFNNAKNHEFVVAIPDT